MDDLARELGMSKKTIYRFVEDKRDLVKQTMEFYLANERKQLEDILSPSKNSIDEMVAMIQYFMNQVQEFNPSALNDLQKYYPETWEIYNQYRYHFMLGKILDNLKHGVKQGVYRTDLNADVVSRVYIGGIDILINQTLFPVKKYAYINLYTEYLNYHFRGIVSAKGLKMLEQQNLLTTKTT